MNYLEAKTPQLFAHFFFLSPILPLLTEHISTQIKLVCLCECVRRSIIYRTHLGPEQKTLKYYFNFLDFVVLFLLKQTDNYHCK